MKNKEIFIVIGIIIIALVLVVSFGKSDNNKSKEEVTDGQSILENAQKESQSSKKQIKEGFLIFFVKRFKNIKNR